MKKILLLTILILSIIFMFSTKIGAKMSTQTNEVRASHILVSSQKEAGELREKITKNEISFEDAAAKYSSCPSGAKGGDLGYFPKGVMVKEFETAAFNGNVNEVSEPIQTQFGWHLIKVTDKR